MRILLTGSTGFTGKAFERHARSLGHEIHSLKADLRDTSAIESEVQLFAPEWVVHLAAISFVGHADDIEFYSVNVVGTLNLLAAISALSVKPKKVLLASSANVYGNCDKSPISETQSAAPVNHYATSKLCMEHMARTFADKLPMVFARPFNYTGLGQAKNFLIPKLVEAFKHRESEIQLGNLNVYREFNDVRMVCSAYILLLEHGQPGSTFNICTGNTFALPEVLKTLSDLSNHELQVKVNPAFVRPNEILKLCGDPTKLYSLAQKNAHHLPEYSLRNTLQWMLQDQHKI
jgi:GDP-6-deoxy-D-talose 4-dehydrogenase